MADVIRDVVIRYKLEPVEGKVPVPKTGAAQKGLDELGKKVKDTNKKIKTSNNEIADSFKKIGDEIAKSIKETEKATREYEKFARDAKDQSLRANEGFRTAGEGAITLARGVTFLGLSSEENMAKMVQGVARVQGAFDLFKGSIDVVKGLRDGLAAARAASLAQEAANIKLAASNVGVAATGTAAAGGMAALGTALLPVGVALAAAGAAYLIFKDDGVADGINKSTEALKRQTDALSKQQQVLAKNFELKRETLALDKTEAQEESSISKQERGLLGAGERVAAVTSRQSAVSKQIDALRSTPDRGGKRSRLRQGRIDRRVNINKRISEARSEREVQVGVVRESQARERETGENIGEKAVQQRGFRAAFQLRKEILQLEEERKNIAIAMLENEEKQKDETIQRLANMMQLVQEEKNLASEKKAAQKEAAGPFGDPGDSLFGQVSPIAKEFVDSQKESLALERGFMEEIKAARRERQDIREDLAEVRNED